MALQPKEKVPIQDFDPSGKSYHEYAAVKNYIGHGDPLTLVADPSNIHDAKAVKVLFREQQIGWVPKGENADIAARLKRGEQLTAEVIEHRPFASAMQVRVYAAGPAEPLDKVDMLDVTPSNRERGTPLPSTPPAGLKLYLRSNSNRSSVTIHNDNRDLAWFDRRLLQDETLRLIDKGQARVIHVGGAFEIWHKDHVPDVIVSGGRQTGKASAAAFYSANLAKPFEDLEEISPEYLAATRITSNHPNLQQISKETAMTLNQKLSNTVTSTIDLNKRAAGAAAYNEAGRIANNQLTKVAAKGLPMMVRGYADTPIGRLVMANIAQMAAAQLRPNDPTLQKLTFAMTTAAYQEVIQTIDIEGMLDGLLEQPDMKRALRKLGEADSVDEK